VVLVDIILIEQGQINHEFARIYTNKIRSFLEIRCSHSVASLYSLYLLFFGALCSSGDAGGWVTEMHGERHREPWREGKVGNKKWLCEALSKNSVRLSVKSVCASGDAGG
jgi:hypothetical protein